MADKSQTTDLLMPICHGVSAVNRSGPCPRCGATMNDTCGDVAARDYQAAALETGEAEIVKIEF